MDGRPDGVNHLGQVEGDDDATPQLFLIEKRGRNRNPVAANESLYQSYNLPEQILFVSFPRWPNLVIHVTCYLEYNLLGSELSCQFSEVNFRDPRHVRP